MRFAGDHIFFLNRSRVDRTFKFILVDTKSGAEAF